MAAFGVSLIAILFFILTFVVVRIKGVSQRAIAIALEGATAMLDPALDDDEKETVVRSSGLALLASSLKILLGFALCFGAATMPVLLFDSLGWVRTDSVVNLMLRWDYIVGTSAALIGMAWVYGRYKKKPDLDTSYSNAEQFIHKLAFSRPAIQLKAAKWEDRLFKKSIAAIEDQAPVFITALPRAGTTILLTALSRCPDIATHRYRDMPFVLSPLLWSRLSRPFAKTSKLKERAHKDGIQVGFDSPEAFEDVIWSYFWPEKYHDKYIDLWHRNDVNPIATTFFKKHFRKIVSLRAPDNGRYVSKNNNNISRLELLPVMFPNAQIVLPFRDPAEHSASLMRQHENFSKLHKDDAFAKQYMQDIGHFEFGELHRPFPFPGSSNNALTPDDPNYWLSYWIAAYGNALKHLGRLTTISLEKISTHPEQVMLALCDILDIKSRPDDLANQFRPIQHRAQRDIFDPSLLSEAMSVYGELQAVEI